MLWGSLPMRAFLQMVLVTLATGQEFGSGTRFITNETLVSSTCTGAFNTPCAIGVVNRLVEALANDLQVAANAAAKSTILAAVTSGATPYAEPINFWTTVYSAGGFCLASGRPPIGGTPTGCSEANGISAEAMATNEAGFSQPGLWGHIVSAADSGDGYFTYVGYDHFNKRVHTQDAVACWFREAGHDTKRHVDVRGVGLLRRATQRFVDWRGVLPRVRHALRD